MTLDRQLADAVEIRASAHRGIVLGMVAVCVNGVVGLYGAIEGQVLMIAFSAFAGVMAWDSTQKCFDLYGRCCVLVSMIKEQQKRDAA